MRYLQHRRGVLTVVLFSAGLIVAFLAGSKLFFNSTFSRYDAEGDGEIIKTLRSGGETNAGIVEGLKTKSLSELLRNTTNEGQEETTEISQNIGSNEAKVERKNGTSSPSTSRTKVEDPQNSKTEPKAADSSTSSPKSIEITNMQNKTPAPVTPCPNPAEVKANRTRGVEVLSSTPSPAEANDVLWALIIHFTGKADRFKMVTSTWFKRTHPRMAIVIFTSERNMALVSPSGIPTVYYPSNESVTEHTLQAMRRALSMFPNAVYITKSDDDAYVFTQRLANTLFSNIPYNYQGQRCPSQNSLLKLGDDFTYACGGGGYTLTRYAAEKLVNLSTIPWHVDYEDVGVGIRLKHALGSNFGFHAIDVFWNNFWAAMRLKPTNGPLLSYHYITPPVMESMHQEAYHWRPVVPRSPVPKIFHHLENETIHHSCRDINPKWTIMTWTIDTLKGLSSRSQKDSAFVQYDVLFRHGGIYLTSNDTCKQPLDARLDRLAEDFEQDGYYLAYDFHEHGFRSGLFVMRPLSDVAMTLYRATEANLRNHPLDSLKSSRINIAILPATGLFERRLSSAAEFDAGNRTSIGLRL